MNPEEIARALRELAERVESGAVVVKWGVLESKTESTQQVTFSDLPGRKVDASWRTKCRLLLDYES